MRRRLAQLLTVLVLTVNITAAQPRTNAEARKPARQTADSAKRQSPAKPKAYQVGPASWYGKYFHGRKTASGETYNMFQFTAAHPKLPLGTYVKVTNLSNGEWVIVRVNDRGPVPKHRIIDLSYGAATMLKLRRAGLAKVRLDLVKPEEMAMLNTSTSGAMQ